MKLGVGADLAVLLGGSAVAWTLSFDSAPRAAAVSSTPDNRSRADRGTPGRIFLTSAQVNQALATKALDRPVRSLLAVSAPLHFGDFVWNDAGVPTGTTWLRVDLRSQLISVFRAGHEIGTAVIVYGADDKQTPAGHLHILGKARDHRSSLYDAAMPYTLRLTDDGVSIHASSVRWGAATHGCIGVPPAFAKRLFEATHVGDEVLVVRPAVAAANRET